MINNGQEESGEEREHVQEKLSHPSHSLTITLTLEVLSFLSSTLSKRYTTLKKRHEAKKKVHSTILVTCLCQKVPQPLLALPCSCFLYLPSFPEFQPFYTFFLSGDMRERGVKKTYSFDRLREENEPARLNLEPKWQKRIGSLQLNSRCPG